MIRTLAAAALLIATALPAAAFETRATAAYVVDQTTGTVLLNKNADTPLPPASMSKLMTLYMAFEALERVGLGALTPGRRTHDLSGGEVQRVTLAASLAASALLGSPLAHDHALVSLSDLLTPWAVIERRIEAVAAADMAVAFYNPRSQRRTTQLERAAEILRLHRPASTPVGIVVNATRPGEQIHVTTLGELDVERVDMFSIVVVGSSMTELRDGRMVTPRGYDV